MWVFEKLPIDIVEIVITISRNKSYLFETLQTMIEKLKRKDISDRIKDKLTICNKYINYDYMRYGYYYNGNYYRSYDKPNYFYDVGSHNFMYDRTNEQPTRVGILTRSYREFPDTLMEQNITENILVTIQYDGTHMFIKNHLGHKYCNDGSLMIYDSDFVVISNDNRLNKYIN